MKTVLFIFISMFFTSCNGVTQESKKQAFIKEYEQLVWVIEGRDAIDERTWLTDFDPKFVRLNEEYLQYEPILNESDFGVIRNLRDRYKIKRVKSKAANTVKDVVRGTKDFFNELTH